jgi:two-component system heavy metal sensor histidine kinase CusS
MVVASLLVGLAWITLSATATHFVELDESYLQDKAIFVKEIGISSESTHELKERIARALAGHTGLDVFLYKKDRLIYQSNKVTLPSSLVADILKKSTPDAVFYQQSGQSSRMAAIDIHLGESDDSSSLQAILSLSTVHHDHYLITLQRLIWAYVLIGIAIGGFLGWWVVKKGLEPLRPIIAKTSHINASQLSDRIPTHDMPAELRPLTETINQMLQRLEADFVKLSDFSSDLAHELRTPISNMLVQAQVTLAKDRDLIHYQEVLLSTVEELERLSHMVSDMLYLAKTENQLELPRQEQIDLRVQAVELSEFYGLMTEDNRVQIHVQGHGAIHGDRSMVRRAISNILSNALRHAAIDSTVTITILAGDNATSLSVKNIGPTIPASLQLRLFDRFFRVDVARTHPGTEGAGLGLAITHAVMRAHGGSIELSSVNGQTIFTLIFPRR